MSLFHRKTKSGTFIKIPMYDPKEQYIHDLYGLIYYPPMNSIVMKSKGYGSIDKSLYELAGHIIRISISQLYQIPSVRQYYGKDFVHGVTCKYDSKLNSLIFNNLDDTTESEEYIKELTVCLEKVLIHFLEKENLYINYQGEQIKFVTKDTMPKSKHLRIDNRIVWDE